MSAWCATVHCVHSPGLTYSHVTCLTQDTLHVQSYFRRIIFKQDKVFQAPPVWQNKHRETWDTPENELRLTERKRWILWALKTFSLNRQTNKGMIKQTIKWRFAFLELLTEPKTILLCVWILTCLMSQNWFRLIKKSLIKKYVVDYKLLVAIATLLLSGSVCHNLSTWD